MKYIVKNTTNGKRYFPDTDDDQFNKWCQAGYRSVMNMERGYYAFLYWVKKLDYKTLKEIPN